MVALGAACPFRTHVAKSGRAERLPHADSVDGMGAGRLWSTAGRSGPRATVGEYSPDWAPPTVDKTALILDLPAELGVHFGLSLAGQGFRPVPLYNGCPGPSELIDHTSLLRTSNAGAEYLSNLALPADAPPVFLLDSRPNSLPRALTPGMLDNRWKVYPDDLPPAQLLHSRGISRVLLVQRDQVAPHDDLALILRIWDSGGVLLEVKYLSVVGPPHRLHLLALTRFRLWLHSLQSKLGPQSGPAR
jgi:hypothetical protein